MQILLYNIAGIGFILIAMLVSQHSVLQMVGSSHGYTHILLSTLTVSVLLMACLQALLLAMVEHALRTKPQSRLLRKMPAIESMEQNLFQIIAMGFVLLTVLLGTSFYFYYPLLWQQFLSKAITGISAWLVFATLLGCRLVLGWRGRKAVYCTLVGVALLSIAYLFGQLIEHLIR